MALPFRMPPEMGLSGPLRKGTAGASPSDLTAGPPAAGAAFEVVAAGAGTLSVGAAALSSEATSRLAAVLRCAAVLAEGCCCAAVFVAAGDGLGCAAATPVCAFRAAGGGCAVFEAGAVAGGAGVLEEAGCDIFAIIDSSRK